AVRSLGGPVGHDGPDERRQPRARRLRDAGRLRRRRGDVALRDALLRCAGDGGRRSRRRERAARAAALRAVVSRGRARPGRRVDRRPVRRVGAARVPLRSHAADGAGARAPARHGGDRRARRARLSPVRDRRRLRAVRGAAPGHRAHAHRRAAARGGRQPAHGRLGRRERAAPVHARLLARRRGVGARRRTGDRGARHGAGLRDAVSRAVPDRRRDRRAGQRAGHLRRFARARHRRHRRQVPVPGRRRLPDLRADDGAAVVAPAGPDGTGGALRSMASRRGLSGARWHPLEALPWLFALAVPFLFPGYAGLGVQVLIAVLFVLSLDLVLGYAGIVTLGHAAFFGVGAYTVGLLSVRAGWNEPISGLVFAALAAAALGWAVGRLILRFHGLAVLMLTLAAALLLQEAGNSAAAITGGHDGLTGITIAPILGR